MKIGRPVYVYQLPVTGVFMYGTDEHDLYLTKHWKTREAAQRNADKYNKKTWIGAYDVKINVC